MSPTINLKLKKSSNFSDIEELAAQVLASNSVKLQVPNSLAFGGGLGLEGAALQILATWLRTSSDHTLHTSVQSCESDSFIDLCNSLFGLSALRLSGKILTSDKHEVSLSQAIRPAIPIFRHLRSEDFKRAFKGPYLAVPAIKSPVIKGGQDREFDSPLYNNEKVVGAEKFQQITEKALASIFPSYHRINDSVVFHLSEILRELFTNTHRHARSDISGSPYAKNFRGLIFNSIGLTSSRMDEISKSGGANLVLFLGDWRPEGDHLFKALDITVVDSGPGFARRWTKTDKTNLSFESERDAIVECFSKHKSTDTMDSSGSGLSNVLRDLRELKGWFRLRTGRTLVERSFFTQSGEIEIAAKHVKSMDSFMEGSVFNVIIPIESIMRTS